MLCVQVVTDMEEVFLNLGLDIIGLGVFNYEFKSMTKESPVIKARLPCLSKSWALLVTIASAAIVGQVQALHRPKMGLQAQTVKCAYTLSRAQG